MGFWKHSIFYKDISFPELQTHVYKPFLHVLKISAASWLALGRIAVLSHSLHEYLDSRRTGGQLIS